MQIATLFAQLFMQYLKILNYYRFCQKTYFLCCTNVPQRMRIGYKCTYLKILKPNNAETTKTISRTIIMIHEALPAILIRADKSSFFQTILKSVELFIVLCEFPFCQTLDGRNLWWPYKSMFLSRSVKICTCLPLLHANIWLKSRCVEGLLLKCRAFLTNLHVHCIKTFFCKVLYIF